MKVSIRLSDEDRERYGGPEWVDIDMNDLPGLGYDRLAELEKPIKQHDNTSIARILSIEWPQTSMVGFRGVAWMARQLAGLVEPAWPDFKPDVLGGMFKVATGDADPPTGGSSEPPSAKTAPAKNSRSKKD